jgi:hypothetical protein
MPEPSPDLLAGSQVHHHFAHTVVPSRPGLPVAHLGVVTSDAQDFPGAVVFSVVCDAFNHEVDFIANGITSR